ncbi:hypothetical protein EJB05_51172, partial [Eragrostis curvula]
LPNKHLGNSPPSLPAAPRPTTKKPTRLDRAVITYSPSLPPFLPSPRAPPPLPFASSLRRPSVPAPPNPRPESPGPMRWDAAEAGAALERIWDLHDRLSDAILATARARLLLPAPAPAPSAPPAGAHRGGGGCCRNGCVFVKGGAGEVEGAALAAAEAVAEARSLHAIRSALEDLEDNLEFLHVSLFPPPCSATTPCRFPAALGFRTVQSQQRAERDAAIARLEQSRLVLSMRLAEHQGKKFRVIDDALEFVGEVSAKGRFISPEDVRATQSQSGNNAEDNRSNSSRIMANVLSCSLSLAKNSFRLDKIGGALGNAAVFAVSMLAFLQLHQIAFGSRTPAIQYRKRIEYRFSGSSQANDRGKHLEVYLARG